MSTPTTTTSSKANHYYAAVAFREYVSSTGAKASRELGSDRKSLVVITPSYDGHSAFLLHGSILELMSLCHTFGAKYAIEAKDNALVVEFMDL
jgi:hypothetical protein